MFLDVQNGWPPETSFYLTTSQLLAYTKALTEKTATKEEKGGMIGAEETADLAKKACDMLKARYGILDPTPKQIREQMRIM